MKPDLILVANAADAWLYAHSTRERGLLMLDTLHAPESRLHSHELDTGPIGHERSDSRPGGVMLASRMDAQHKRQLAFARHLAQRIDTALQTHAYGDVVLFAACPFLGKVKNALGPDARKALRDAVPLDLTHFDGDELSRRVNNALRSGVDNAD
ncbi:MAG: host attachment protein [Comamonas sp.]|nr:host attachment protein [Comamonas sp.]